MDNFDMFFYMNGFAHVAKSWGYKFQTQWIQTKNYNHKRKGGRILLSTYAKSEQKQYMITY